MKRQIFSSIFVMALISTLLMSVLIFVVMYGQFFSEVKKSIANETSVIRTVKRCRGTVLKGARREGIRITLIDAPHGDYDSVADGPPWRIMPTAE
jgi:hypothetical protein